jgi:glycosyltransferase involved in cell wall biosynthesis
LKIVHVVESLAVGGLERVVLQLAIWQRRRGDTCRIICLFDEGALAGEARAAGIEVLAIGKTRGPDLRALKRLRSAIRNSHADAVHTHNAVSHYYTAAAVLGLGVTRTVNTRHGMGPAQGRARLERLYRAALLGTHAAVSVCDAGRERFVSIGAMPESKAVVIPNGVSVAAIEPRNDAAKLRLLAQLGRSAESVVIGIVGRLNPIKDHATLLRAVSLLILSGRSVQLVIVGDGPTRASLESLADTLPLGKCVHFLGMRDDVSQLLPAFDIFALSSLSEGYSLALVEAAAAGLPIVATRVGGNADIVAHGKTGLLVETGDASALAGALEKLVDDATLRQRMGARSRDWALKFGTVEAMGQAYMELYHGQPPFDAQQRHDDEEAQTRAEA